MASNNLRVIYQNIVDMTGSTIAASSVASSTNTPIANTQSDLKSRVWRTAGASTNTCNAAFVVTVSNAITISAVVLAFCNLSSVATIRVRGFTGTTPTLGATVDTAPTVTTTGATTIFDTNNLGTYLAAPYQAAGDWNWGSNPGSSTAYSNTRVYGRIWIPDAYINMACTSFVVEINDTNCPDRFIEVSRIIMGSYWFPKYNTSYGLSATIKDMSTTSRTEAGDLVTFVAPYYNTLSLDLKYLTKDDRTTLFKIIKAAGIRRAFYINLFPNNSDDWGKEQTYQCYGKLVTIPGLTHDMFDIYSSQIEIEEI
jgi:hypothetical protein